MQSKQLNFLNPNFQSTYGIQNGIKSSQNSQQQYSINYPVNLDQDLTHISQDFSGIHIFSCIKHEHEDNPLNLVCIDRNCQNKGAICTLCMHFEHQRHETLPLQIFIMLFKEQLTKQQNQLNGNNPIDYFLERIMSIQNEVIESLKLFSQKTYEAIGKTKDCLYQIFLQEINDYQSLDMRIQELVETVSMYESNLIQDSIHHTELIQKMISRITQSKNNNQNSFILNLISEKYDSQLDNIYNQMTAIQKNVENEIQDMHQKIQQSLQNILDCSTQSQISIDSNTHSQQNKQILTVNQSIACQQSLNSSKNNYVSNNHYNSNKQNTFANTSNNILLQKKQSNLSGLPLPPLQNNNIKQQQQKSYNSRKNSQFLNSSLQTECSQYNNLCENSLQNSSYKPRRKETHLLSRSYASSVSPKQVSPQRNNVKCFIQHNSFQNFKEIINQTPNFTLEDDNLQISPLHRIHAHNNVIRDMIAVGNSKFATCSYDTIIKIWNKNNSNIIQELKGHSDEVYQLSYSIKHNLLASSSYDKTIRIWKEYQEWKQLVTLRGHEGKTWAVRFIDVYNKLATGGNDRIIRIWNIFNGDCESQLDGHSDTIWSLFILRDGNRLASGDNRHIKIWDYKQGKIIKNIQAHEDRIYQLKEVLQQINNRQMILISTSMDRKVKIWNSFNYCLIYQFCEQMIITSLEFIQDRNIIIVGLWGDKKDGSISFWSLPNEVKQKENMKSQIQPYKIKDYLQNYSGVSQLIYDNDTQKLFTSHSNGYVEVASLKWK